MDSSKSQAVRARSKISTLALGIGIACVSLSCATTQEGFEAGHWDVKKNGPIPSFSFTSVEILKPEMLPGSGAYYIIYQAPDAESQILDVPNKLRRLYALEFDITLAWYRRPLNGCNKPGADDVTKTMYPEFLLLLLSKRNESAAKYNFLEIPRPTSLACPYRVSIYYPQFQP